LGKIFPELMRLNDINLNLNGTEIDDTGMTGFEESLKLCTNLTSFSTWLGSYQVDDEGMSDLLESLRSSKQMITLKLDISSRGSGVRLVQKLSNLIFDL